jgi:HD superfamily phosphohydrolase
MPERTIRDPIHGDIRLGDEHMELVDTPYFQRLRNIKQNGVCYLVYPAMNSTRFEHCLGTYHLSNTLSEHLGLPEADQAVLTASCLLHDLGHGPFSHTFDELWESHGLDHERESQRIVCETEVADLLNAQGTNPKKVAETIAGQGRLGKLLSSEVDVDKMDYLIRDAYYAGVAYGVTDVQRLLSSIKLEKGEVVVDIGGLEAAESLLISRNMMYQTVYRHHTKRIGEAMITHAISRLVDGGADPGELFRMDDIDLVSLMRSSGGYTKEIIERLDERSLYKNVFSERIALLTDETKKELEKNHQQVEEKIASDYGIGAGYLLLDYPETTMSEYRVKVATKDGFKSVIEVSALAKSLEESEKTKLTVNIYTPREEREKFKDFKSEKYFSYQQTKLSGYI